MFLYPRHIYHSFVNYGSRGKITRPWYRHRLATGNKTLVLEFPRGLLIYSLHLSS